MLCQTSGRQNHANTEPGTKHFIIINITVLSYKVADPHHFNADPNSALHQTDANQRPRHWSTHPLGLYFEHPRLHYECQRPSTAPYWASTPPLWASAALFGSILGLHASIVSFSGPPRLHWWASKALEFFDWNANPDPAFQNNADPDPQPSYAIRYRFEARSQQLFLILASKIQVQKSFLWIRIRIAKLYLYKCHGKNVVLAMETYKYYCKKLSMKGRNLESFWLASVQFRASTIYLSICPYPSNG